MNNVHYCFFSVIKYSFTSVHFTEDQCYGERVILINQTKTWQQAQAYCRENHIDLASDIDPDRDYQGPIWIGVFRDTWRWADGSHFSYRNWDLDDTGVGDCAAYNAHHLNGTWSASACGESKSFYCYSGEFYRERLHFFFSPTETGRISCLTF